MQGILTNIAHHQGFRGLGHWGGAINEGPTTADERARIARGVASKPSLKLRELLVWQLVTGYRLRELEAREELNRALTGEPE